MATYIEASDGKKIRTYLGHPSVKAHGEVVQYTAEQIEELIKCKNDVNYFIENYCYIDTLDRGQIIPTLYDYQKKFMKFADENRFSLIVFPRQASKTTSSMLYILHDIVFSKDQHWYVMANKGESARENLARLITAYESLPYWMQPGCKKLNASTLKLSNNSKVQAAATSKSAIRGRSANIYLDEFAFVDNDDAFFTAVFPVISSSKTAKIIMTSTPNGPMNKFADLYYASKKGKGEFSVMELEWDEVPGRDEAWRQKTIETIGERQFRIEFECSFEGASNTLIPPDILERMHAVEPIKQDDLGHLAQYEAPIEDRMYIMTVDVAHGNGGDASTYNVFDVSRIPYKQVARYRNNTIDAMVFPHAIVPVARAYNNAYVLVENNDLGAQVANILFYDLSYENMLFTEFKGRTGQIISVGGNNARLGVRMTAPVKLTGCINLRTMMDDGKMEIVDRMTIRELSTFVKAGATYKGDKNAHDDLAMTLVSFAWLMEQDYIRDLTSTNIRASIAESKLDEIEDMLSSIVIITHADDEIVMDPVERKTDDWFIWN